MCADIMDTFRGYVEQEGIRMQWDTAAEDASVSGYIVRRGATPVYAVEARGTCGQSEEYSYTDQPGPGQWTYTLEAVRMSGAVACTRTITIE